MALPRKITLILQRFQNDFINPFDLVLTVYHNKGRGTFNHKTVA